MSNICFVFVRKLKFQFSSLQHHLFSRYWILSNTKTYIKVTVERTTINYICIQLYSQTNATVLLKCQNLFLVVVQQRIVASIPPIWISKQAFYFGQSSYNFQLNRTIFGRKKYLSQSFQNKARWIVLEYKTNSYSYASRQCVKSNNLAIIHHWSTQTRIAAVDMLANQANVCP